MISSEQSVPLGRKNVVANFDYRYRYKNRFAFLGNGDIKATVTKDVEGLSAYMRDSDHEWHVE